MDDPITRRRFLSYGAAALAAATAPRAYAVNLRSGDQELLELSASDVVMLLRKGEITSEHYCSALLSQCQKMHGINAFIWLNSDRLLETARTADQRPSHASRRELEGLPLVLKDNIGTKLGATTAGTPGLKANYAGADAPVAKALFSAGALLLGKTNMHELAYGITSNNAGFGAVHNPYNLSMIPGGSSGGTAAAIAARMCPAGLGTDTGGSVRIPAALCGIAGLRTTVGRYSLKGVVPLSHTRDAVGPMARSVEDLVLLDSVITQDRSTVHPSELKGMRLGVPRGYFFDELDSELAPVIENALTQLRSAGCVLIEADIPDIERLGSIGGRIGNYEFVADLTSYLKDSGSRTSVEDVLRQIASPDVRTIYETSVTGPNAPTAEWYEHALKVDRPALQAAYRSYFATHNVQAIVYPTTILPARQIGHDSEVDLNGKQVSTFLAYLRNTRIMTSAGIPGLSMPVGLTRAELPVGMEFDAPAGRDRELLGIGLAAERVFGRLPSPMSLDRHAL